MGALDSAARVPPPVCGLEEHLVNGYLKFNLDTGAAVTALPKAWFPGKEDADDSHRGYLTASGERIGDYGGRRL
eukprot:8458006-Pyramimonas_sp.AAC.1